jgi:hypothetical protein
LHSLTPEQRSEGARKAATVSAFVRKSKAEPRASVGVSPTVSLLDVLAVCLPALSATFEHTGEPDWSARLAAAGTLLAAFPRYLRDTPEGVRELLETILPERLRDELGEQLEPDSVYSAMRAEWDELRVRHHPVTGLYVEAYPNHLIAPYESTAKIQASRPKPEGRVERVDGRLVLHRPGKLPQFLEDDEDAA